MHWKKFTYEVGIIKESYGYVFVEELIYNLSVFKFLRLTGLRHFGVTPVEAGRHEKNRIKAVNAKEYFGDRGVVRICAGWSGCCRRQEKTGQENANLRCKRESIWGSDKRRRGYIRRGLTKE